MSSSSSKDLRALVESLKSSLEGGYQRCFDTLAEVKSAYEDSEATTEKMLKALLKAEMTNLHSQMTTMFGPGSPLQTQIHQLDELVKQCEEEEDRGFS